MSKIAYRTILQMNNVHKGYFLFVSIVCHKFGTAENLFHSWVGSPSILSCVFSNYFPFIETIGVVREAPKHATLLTSGRKMMYTLIEDDTRDGLKTI